MIERQMDGDIAILRLARGKGNALNIELLEAIDRAMEEVEREAVKAIVVTGQGSSFSAGVDLNRLAEEGTAYVERFLPALSKTFYRLQTFPKPLVAAVNGHALAGGCLIAVACDYRLMVAGDGRIGLTELTVGVPFPTIALEIARHAMGPAVMAEAVLTAKRYTPAEALSSRMVHELVAPEELMPRSLAVAQQFAAVPAETFRLTKKQILLPFVERVERWKRHDAEVHQVWMKKEVIEGIRSYMAQVTKKK